MTVDWQKESLTNYIEKKPKTQIPCVTDEKKKKLQEMIIVEEDIFNRNRLREKVNSYADFQEKPKKKTGALWTDEWKKQHWYEAEMTEWTDTGGKEMKG